MGVINPIKSNPTCSFCGKDQRKVNSLIAGPNDIYICNECVEICNKTIPPKKAFPSEPKFSVSEERVFCAILQFYKPAKIEEMLNWLNDNVKNSWVNTYQERGYDSATYKILFENESDLIAFKIRWI